MHLFIKVHVEMASAASHSATLSFQPKMTEKKSLVH